MILAGDFNDRWTNAELSINKLTDAGFEDPWVELVKRGTYPEPGSDAAPCDVPAADNNCETVDKVLYVCIYNNLVAEWLMNLAFDLRTLFS